MKTLSQYFLFIYCEQSPMALRSGHKATSQKVFPAANKTRQPCDPDGQGPQRPPELPNVLRADRYQVLLLMKPCGVMVKGCRLSE